MRDSIDKFFAVFIIVFQVCIWPGQDLDDIRKAMIMFAGFGGFGYLALKSGFKPTIFHALLTIPVIVLLAVSAFNWTQGYTIYWLSFIVALLGLVFLLGEAKYNKWILRALLLCIPIQVFFTYAVYFGINVFQTSQYNGSFHISNFGTFRHAIRYSTWIFAGLIAGWLILHNDRTNKTWRIVATSCMVIGSATLFHANSNTLLVITPLAFIVLIYHKYGYETAKRVAWLGFVSFCLFMMYQHFILHRFEFVLDAGRKKLWIDCIKQISFLGHGAWSYNLLVNSAHPHNELLNCLFDFGVVGTFFVVGWWMLFVLVGIVSHKMVETTAFVGISLSFLTNSGRYMDMAFICVLFAGLLFANIEKSWCEL